MPWVRFDDQFPTHRKVEGLSDGAFRLHVTAIFWCARNLTDGWVPQNDLSMAAPRTCNRPEKLVHQLVTRGVWHEPGHDCPDCPAISDGWVIHDYLEFQPSKADVEAERAANRERQRKWRDRQRRT